VRNVFDMGYIQRLAAAAVPTPAPAPATVPLPAPAAPIAILRLDIYIDIFSQTLQTNHIVVLPFLVGVGGYVNDLSGNNINMSTFTSLLDAGQIVTST